MQREARRGRGVAGWTLSALLGLGSLAAVIGCDSGAPPATATPAGAGVPAGQRVYARYCDQCHPGGHRGSGPPLAGLPDSDAEIAAVVRHGKRNMPGFSTAVISNSDLDSLIGYIRTLK